MSDVIASGQSGLLAGELADGMDVRLVIIIVIKKIRAKE